MKLLPQRRVRRTHIRRDEPFHGLADQLFTRVTEQLFAPGVGHSDDPRRVGHHQSVRRELEDAAEELLGLTQPLVGLLPPRDVGKADDGAEECAILDDRRRRIFDGKALAVFSPQEFVVHTPLFAALAGRAHRTVFDGILAAVRPVVMNERVRLLTNHFFGREAQQAAGRGIHKGDAAVGCHAVNAVTSRIQNESRALLSDLQSFPLRRQLALLGKQAQVALQHFETQCHQRQEVVEEGGLARAERMKSPHLYHT